MEETVAAELLELAAAVARDAARLVMRRRGARHTGVATKSTRTDMVSDVDRASEAQIVDRLLAERPADGILAEEGSGRDGTSGVRWVIDPLDGTTNYLYGHDAFAVSIAAELDGRAVAGVVVDVVHDETFTATAGGGAFVNGEPIAVSACAELATALVGTGFAYDPRARAAQGVVLTRVLPRVRDIRRRGAAALDLCWVGVGRLDAFYESGLAPWDLAAGGLIAAEAGAVVRESPGTSGGRAVVAATPAIADDLMALLSG